MRENIRGRLRNERQKLEVERTKAFEFEQKELERKEREKNEREAEEMRNMLEREHREKLKKGTREK